MAAVTDVQTVNISINGIELSVPKDELIVESVKRLGLEIPIFCYHPRMKPVGMCRMCIVEVGFKQPDGSVRKMPKPQAACTLPASEGMAVFTDSEMVHRDRKGVLEFLLINHPLDCPICDRGGECPLQNNTLFYGPSTTRFVELKRHLPKAFPLSKYVTLDLERCIQCGRCVRFTEEISGDAQLAFRFRGASMQPSTFEMRDFDSKFSGNVIEICPVGALTSAKYRFRARPWDLETRPAICTLCSNGCNIWFDYRVNQVVRVNGRTNDAVNEEWTCDKGKFGHDFYNENRVTKPMIRQGDSLVETDWATAYAAAMEAFAVGGNKVAALAGSGCSNEDLFMLQKLFRKGFKSNNLDHRFRRHLPKANERIDVKLGTPHVQSTLASFENAKSILVFGTSLADEEPILFLRVRKAWFNNGTKVIVAHDSATDVDSFAHLVLRYKSGTGGILAEALAQAASGTKGKYTPEVIEKETGVRATDFTEAVSILKEGSAPTITTLSLYDLSDGPEIARQLVDLAKSIKGEFNLFALGANDQGADELGFLPDLLPGGRTLDDSGHEDYRSPSAPGLGTHGILEGCISGSVKALWLSGCDPIESYADSAMATKALESVEFLVVQAATITTALEYASVVFPMTAPAEGEGTYTNLERRVQRFKRILAPKGDAKPGWRTHSEIMVRLSPETPMFNASEVMSQIVRQAPRFAGAEYNVLPPEGYVLS